MKNQNDNIIEDFAIIALSVLVAFLLAKTEALKTLLVSTQSMEIIGSVIAGMFFTSVFSAAPATVVIGEIAQANSVFLVAFFGGIGAMIGDFVIFRFVRDRLAEDFLHLIRKTGSERLVSIFRLRLFRMLVPFLGALVVASPFPDEVGLAMMGLSKMRASLFLLIVFLLNFSGILVVGFVAKAVF